jgi:hypothetical protein
MRDNGGDNGDTDIIDQIDNALTDDAASWTATGAHETPQWNRPAPGAMTAVLLGVTSAHPIEISRTNPGEDRSRLVGDPFVDRVRHLDAVGLWVGGNSVATAPVNTNATRFLHHLLSDVRDGDYIASDHEREHVRQVLADPDAAPVIHGPCLVTGVDAEGEPGELDANFQHWFTQVLAIVAEIAERHHAIAHDIGHAVAQALGIPPDRIGQVVVIGLD